MKGMISQQDEDSKKIGRDVWIIRHGQTVLNKEDRIRAWLNVPLDKTGIKQARDLALEMVREGIELDGMFVSDLLRTQQTALEISTITGIPVLGTTRSLRPWDVGSLSGTDGKKAHAIMSEHARNNPDAEIAGGESFNQFKFRILSGIIGMLNSNRGLKIGFVSHSRGERILHGWIAAGCPGDLGIDLDVFLARGEETGSAQELCIDCPLIFS